MTNHIRELYNSLQNRLAASLSANRSALTQPVAKGEAAEINWIEMLGQHLPHRYRVCKAFVIDADGNCSDQIDVVVYDRQYTPLLYNQDNQRFIPAESVYAVFEVKQVINKQHVLYAGNKAASVRRLRRTSATIPYAGGTYKPRQPFRILAGILAYESSWHPPVGSSLRSCLKELTKDQQLDLGCVVSAGTFEVAYGKNDSVVLNASSSGTALVQFFFGLLEKLQCLGTVTAIDYTEYMNAFTE